MLFDFHKLPTIILLGALVPIFWSLYRGDRTARVRFWLIGWIVVLVRIFIQVFGDNLGLSPDVVNGVDLGGLQLAGVVFLVSMTRIFQDQRQRLPFFLALAAPSVIYAELFSFNYPHHWVPALLGVTMGIAAFLWVILYHRKNLERYLLVICCLVLALTIWGVIPASRGRVDIGFYTIETVTYALAGFLYWHSYKRLSSGVTLTSVGFFAWAAVFPAFYAATPQQQAMLIGLSNLPKFCVAIGMIVTLLEDKSHMARLAEVHERATRQQIQRFFQVASRLLSGAEVNGFCGDIARVIAESSNFQRAQILLTDDQRNLYIAGSAGFETANLDAMNASLQRLTIEEVDRLCTSGAEVGPHSFRLNAELAAVLAVPSGSDHLHSPNWEPGDKVLVPLLSPRGLLVGCILLDSPREAERVTTEDLAPIEMLSADLAMSIENSLLQRQLVLSEKLAGLGKLVSGAGHELNNPLTAVLGYSEMLATSAQDETTRRGLEVIRRESLRMKQIIDNLLRFARQTRFEKRAVSLASVLEEVLKLRAYDIKRHAVRIVNGVPSDLPGVVVDEGSLKQVFLNILNNSLDAVQGVSGGTIVIEAQIAEGRLQLRFTDNGCGFKNLDRIFDPFFTTKSPGKGPGLGLSVSYGIIKQHGGEISAYNVHPSGAGILIELPLAADQQTIPESAVIAKA